MGREVKIQSNKNIKYFKILSGVERKMMCFTLEMEFSN